MIKLWAGRLGNRGFALYYYYYYCRIKYIPLRAKTVNTKFPTASTLYVFSMICIISVMMYIIRNIWSLFTLVLNSPLPDHCVLFPLIFSSTFHLIQKKNYLGFPGTWSWCSLLISLKLFLLHTSIPTVKKFFSPSLLFRIFQVYTYAIFFLSTYRTQFLFYSLPQSLQFPNSQSKVSYTIAAGYMSFLPFLHSQYEIQDVFSLILATFIYLWIPLDMVLTIRHNFHASICCLTISQPNSEFG